jgi:hypothetical protein
VTGADARVSGSTPPTWPGQRCGRRDPRMAALALGTDDGGSGRRTHDEPAPVTAVALSLRGPSPLAGSMR